LKFSFATVIGNVKKCGKSPFFGALQVSTAKLSLGFKKNGNCVGIFATSTFTQYYWVLALKESRTRTKYCHHGIFTDMAGQS
jgi:hypothetical protein